MKLFDLQKVGSGKQGTLYLPYNEVIEKVFKPNVTELDDPDKVKASWGFKDEKGREAFIWSYKYYGDMEYCDEFSVSGNKDLLREVFDNKVVFNYDKR